MPHREHSASRHTLEWHPAAKIEFDAQSNALRAQLAKKLLYVLENPKAPKNALRGDLAGCYKIKLASAGVRLVYRVIDKRLVVLVLAIGKRSDNEVYETAEGRT